MIPNVGIPELILVLLIIIIILGPGKLPELGKTIGRTVKAYRKEANDGLPPPEGRRRRHLAREQTKHQSPATTDADLLPSNKKPVVEDPGRRGVFSAVFKVFRIIWKIWRWRRRLP